MSIFEWKTKRFLLIILLLQLVFYAAVFFKIQVVRQTIGFLYFTFIPGFVFIKLLGLNRRSWAETLLFSAGFSVAFLMLGGLFLNEILFMFGVVQPLLLTPLIIIFNSLILISGFLVYLKGKNVELYKASGLRLSLPVLLLVCLPILSIVGAMLVNIYENNMLILFMIIVISLLFTVIVFSKNLLLPKLYPLAILMIALALLYHFSFISGYIVSFGSDVPVEYFVYKITESNAYWNTTFSDLQFGRINAMLSVTILPAVYSGLLNIDSTWMFKTIFPLLFSLVPLGLYQIWRKYIGEKRAFISAFLFMAYETFYTEMLGLNRQMIGELFLVLLLFIVLDKKMKRSNKIICFMIFSSGVVTSHYGISEIFLFFVSFALISFFVMKKSSNNITLSMVVLFFILMFGWYVFTSKSIVFNSILEYGDYVYRQLSDFLNPETREPEIMRGLGLEKPPTIWNAISRTFAYITEFFIIIGFIGLITKRLKANYEKEYFIFTLEVMAFLAALIIVPGLAKTMNMTRFYHILLSFLAPLCVLGAEVFVGLVLKRRRELLVSVLLLVVLVPYFLFQTEFIYEIVKTNSWSIPLSKHRMDILWLSRLGYIPETDVFGARWLSENTNTKFTRVYADLYSKNRVITIYGMIYRGDVGRLSNTTRFASNGTIFLGCMNSIGGKIVDQGRLINTSLCTNFSEMSIIYSNGACEIYRNTP